MEYCFQCRSKIDGLASFKESHENHRDEVRFYKDLLPRKEPVSIFSESSLKDQMEFKKLKMISLDLVNSLKIQIQNFGIYFEMKPTNFLIMKSSEEIFNDMKNLYPVDKEKIEDINYILKPSKFLLL